jgi:hypothetical protein
MLKMRNPPTWGISFRKSRYSGKEKSPYSGDFSFRKRKDVEEAQVQAEKA